MDYDESTQPTVLIPSLRNSIPSFPWLGLNQIFRHKVLRHASWCTRRRVKTHILVYPISGPIDLANDLIPLSTLHNTPVKSPLEEGGKPRCSTKIMGSSHSILLHKPFSVVGVIGDGRNLGVKSPTRIVHTVSLFIDPHCLDHLLVA